MAIALGNDRRKSKRRQSHRRKTSMEPIKIGGEVDKGQDVTVLCRTAPQRKEKSTFSWFEEFAVEWSETFLTKGETFEKRRII